MTIRAGTNHRKKILKQDFGYGLTVLVDNKKNPLLMVGKEKIFLDLSCQYNYLNFHVG